MLLLYSYKFTLSFCPGHKLITLIMKTDTEESSSGMAYIIFINYISMDIMETFSFQSVEYFNLMKNP